MLRHLATAALLSLLAWPFAPAAWSQATKFFPEEQIPRFNIPKMTSRPTIDGVIDEAEWRQAVRIMGMATAHNNVFRGRPHAFWVGWDAGHIYIAGRAHVLDGHVLGKSRREKYTTGTVFDDAFEFGLSMEGRNQPPGEVASFFKFILNYLKSGEYLKMYPSIGQYLYNWRPEIEMETRLYASDYDGVPCQWFEIEMALDLSDLEMPVENQAGDLVRLLLAHDGKNPGWQWTCVPSASGYLVHDGYPRAVLTADQPYLQVERFDGLNDEKLSLKSVLHNPGSKPVRLKIDLTVANVKQAGPDDVEPKIGVRIDRTVDLPAGGTLRFDLEEAFPGFTYGAMAEKSRTSLRGAIDWTISLADQPEAPPVYRYYLAFAKDDKKAHLQYTAKPVDFNLATKYNPVTHKIWIEADTLDARLPAGTTAAAATWKIVLDDQPVAAGTVDKFIYWKYQDLIQLPTLAPGKYTVQISLVDAGGQPLLTRETTIEKKDEAKEFPEWWGKKYGNPEQLLKPFEPVRAKGNTLSVTRRTYRLDSLGLPLQIDANDGPVFTAPARVVLVVDGKDYVVPTRPTIKVTEKKDWRVSFEGAPSTVAGVRFQATGMIEQDGLVSLDFTYAPVAGPVRIQELRLEWPVDDAWHNHLAVMGVGGNYSARFIDAVPAGQGEVWSSLRHIGQAGSGMTVGNFFQNLWIGTEKRGFLWYGTNDQGWVPDDRLSAHTIVRDGATTIVRNHLVGCHPGDEPFLLEAPRTVRFSYNASPFKTLTPGWRLNLRASANGFSEAPKYKYNWDTGEQYFSVLSPPFANRDRWAEYYAHCKEVAEQRSLNGIYTIRPRVFPYLNNQIALRGYMRKSLESPIYNYFSADWETSDFGETLNETYRDYMMWLQHRQVTEGGCRHFYYDISMAGKISREIVAGNGYILPDGRIQPGGGDWQMRRWYIRAYALMQDNGIWPTGISGHCTNTIPLVVLPFCDAQLDSEFPMQDPIDVYHSARMIALSHPQTFGGVINHLGFMNPDWAAMHDSPMGGDHGGVFDRAEWRNWGIGRADIDFIPYWRNRHAVRTLGDGLLCSIWKRPGSVILGIMNHGPDKAGFEQSRPATLALDLDALGIPRDARPDQVRLAVLNAGQEFGKVAHFKWHQELEPTPRPLQHDPNRALKLRPAIDPKLDLATGALTGFDIFYHDQYYIAIHWDATPIRDDAWRDDLEPWRAAALDWGVNAASEITGRPSVATPTAGLAVRAWHRPGSAMLLVANPTDKDILADLLLDLDTLKLRVTPDKLWHDFTSIYALDRRPVANVLWNEEFAEKRKHEYTRGALVYDGHLGKVVGLLKPGERRLVCIDTY